MHWITISLISVGVVGGAGVAGAIYHLSSIKSNKDFLISQGYKITEQNDPIWKEGFKQYQEWYESESRRLENLKLEVKKWNKSDLVIREVEKALKNLKLSSEKDLRQKCKEFLAKPSDWQELFPGDYIQEVDDPSKFSKAFCAWRTPLSNLYPQKRWSAFKLDDEKFKKQENKRIFFSNGIESSSSKLMQMHKNTNELGDRNNYFSESLKEAIMDYCNNIKWDLEYHKIGFSNAWKVIKNLRVFCVYSE